MKRTVTTAIISAVALVVLYTSCKHDPVTPPDPCAGITVVVSAATTNAVTGQSNGSITASAAGGSGFTFSLNNGAFQPSGTFSNLAAGTYTVIAKTSTGCADTTQATITAVSICSITNIVVNTTATTATPCTTPSTGSITINATGSTGFTYSVDSGATFQLANTFTNLAAKNYTVMVKDANGCTQTASVSVAVTQAGTLFSAVRTIIQSNCATTGCHAGANPRAGINFMDDCQIITRQARIKVRSVDQAGTPTQMPPPPRVPLSVADRQKITDWIAAGGAYTN